MPADNFSKNTLTESLAPVPLERLAKLEHLILGASVDSVDACLRAFGQPGGVFGERIPYDAQGRPYLEPENSYIIEDFRFWADAANQKLVPTCGAIQKSTGFTMVISAFTSADTLKKLYSKASQTLGYFDWDTFFPATLNMIDEIGWCYIPTLDELDVSVVLASERELDGLRKLKNLLQTRLQPYRYIVSGDKASTVEISSERK